MPRSIYILQDYDTVLDFAAENGIINQQNLIAEKPGPVILQAAAVDEKHDTITIADTLIAIEQPTLNLRIISTKNNTITLGFFDAKTKTNYTEKEFINCFLEVEIYNDKGKPVTSFADSGISFKTTGIQHNYVVLLRAHPLDKRTGYAYPSMEIKYTMP